MTSGTEDAMRRHWRLVKMALRASFWRASAEPPMIGLAGVAGWCVVAAIVCGHRRSICQAAGSASMASASRSAGSCFRSAWARCCSRAEHRASASAAMLVVSTIVLAVVDTLLERRETCPQSADPALLLACVAAVLALHAVWLIGAFAAIVRSFSSDARFAGWGRAAALWAAQLLATSHSRAIRPS